MSYDIYGDNALPINFAFAQFIIFVSSEHRIISIFMNLIGKENALSNAKFKNYLKLYINF